MGGCLHPHCLIFTTRIDHICFQCLFLYYGGGGYIQLWAPRPETEIPGDTQGRPDNASVTGKKKQSVDTCKAKDTGSVTLIKRNAVLALSCTVL